MAVEELIIDRPVTKVPPPVVLPPARWRGDDGGDDSGPRDVPRNALVAMLLFLGTDFMLFAGLIGAFLVFRFGTESWPPFGQPRLPLLVTTINSLILLCSGVTMALAWRALSKVKALRYLLLTMVLGVVFLGIQGLEWMRLIQFGLSLRSSVYGGIFYILIGCHALHVAAAVLWLIVLAIRSSFASAARTSAIKLAGMYWFLVVALWPLLFGFVYL